MSLSELGAFLQRSREERGLSLQDVEAVTRIRARYLEAMETGSWDDLPPGVYTRGLLTSYARSIGVSPKSALRMYVKERPGEARPPEPQLISRPLVTEPRIAFETLLSAAVLMVAAGLFGWMIVTQLWPRIQASQQPPAAATATAAALAASVGPTGQAVPTDDRPTREPLAPPTAVAMATEAPTDTITPGGGMVMTIRADQNDAWITVRADDVESFEGFLRAGEEQQHQAERKLYILTGNAGDTLVELNNNEIGALGDRGAIVEMEWTLDGTGTIVQRNLRAPAAPSGADGAQGSTDVEGDADDGGDDETPTPSGAARVVDGRVEDAV